jgi:ribose-phosphate pyrophosphokinase
MHGATFKFFALKDSSALGASVAAHLGAPIAAHEEREFEDREHKARPLETVAGAEVYVIHSLHTSPDQSPNDKLCRLLFFIGALKDAGASRVSAIAPYLCYARKDRRTKSLDPVITRYVAAMFEAVGTGAIVALDVHNPAAFENAFRCRTVALTATPIFIEHVKPLAPGELCVVSPDTGGAKRAELFRKELEKALKQPVSSAFAEKHRSGGVVSGELFAGDVKGNTALIIDDLISSGTTLVRAAEACRKAGAERVLALVTHGLFAEGSEKAILNPALDGLIITDSVPPTHVKQGPMADKITTLSCAPLLAEAIRRLHENKDLSDLLVF